MNNKRCDYCGFLSDILIAGRECPQCKKGTMCAYGTRGYPKYS